MMNTIYTVVSLVREFDNNDYSSHEDSRVEVVLNTTRYSQALRWAKFDDEFAVKEGDGSYSMTTGEGRRKEVRKIVTTRLETPYSGKGKLTFQAGHAE